MYAAIIFIKSTSKANPDISDYQIIKLSPASLFITTDISFNNPLGDYACKTFSELTQKAYADISVREQWNNFVLEYNNFLNSSFCLRTSSSLNILLSSDSFRSLDNIEK